MSTRSISIIGLVCGVVIILLGVLVVTGLLGDNPSYANNISYPYDSGVAKFGADFYTYVTNNAAEAANASRIAANNLAKMDKLLQNASGILIIGFGLFMSCYFGIKLSEYNCANKRKNSDFEAASPETDKMETEAEASVDGQPQESTPVFQEE